MKTTRRQLLAGGGTAVAAVALPVAAAFRHEEYALGFTVMNDPCEHVWVKDTCACEKCGLTMLEYAAR